MEMCLVKTRKLEALAKAGTSEGIVSIIRRSKQWYVL